MRGHEGRGQGGQGAWGEGGKGRGQVVGDGQPGRQGAGWTGSPTTG